MSDCVKKPTKIVYEKRHVIQVHNFYVMTFVILSVDFMFCSC